MSVFASGGRTLIEARQVHSTKSGDLNEFAYFKMIVAPIVFGDQAITAMANGMRSPGGGGRKSEN